MSCAAASTVTIAACRPTGARAAADTAESTALLLADLRRTVAVAHEKFVALANAMPEDGYAWRPMDGVRSVHDVYVHIAADNYFVPALMGVAAPPETGVTDDPATYREFERREMDKADAVAHLGQSFEHLLRAMDATAGELEREITFWGGSTTTVGNGWIRAVTHLHEHLGQSVAYARANGVVPPWSR